MYGRTHAGHDLCNVFPDGANRPYHPESDGTGLSASILWENLSNYSCIDCFRNTQHENQTLDSTITRSVLAMKWSMQMRVWECCKVKGDYFTLAYRLRNVPDSQQRTNRSRTQEMLGSHFKTGLLSREATQKAGC